MTAPLAAPAGTAPTGAVYTLGLKFREMDRQFERFDEVSRKSCDHPKSARYIKANRRCRKYERARWKAFEDAMTTHARTPADALVQAVHAFERAQTTREQLPKKVHLGAEKWAPNIDPMVFVKMDLANAVAARGDLELLMGALSSLIAFLEPLAGLNADAFGWGGRAAKERAAVLASLGRGARS